MSSLIKTEVKRHLTFKATKIISYRFCDDVWTIELEDVKFRTIQELCLIQSLKIKACLNKND